MTKLSALILMLLLTAACSDVSLVPYKSVQYSKAGASVDFCTTEADTIRSNLKFVIVMDRSTSNQDRYDPATGAVLAPTDPDGSRRFDALIRFVQAFQDDEYVYWSLINFATKASIAENFTNDKNDFLQEVEYQRDNTQSIDGGFTSYINALERAYDIIDDDVESARQQEPLISSTYVVFYISDGAPYVRSGNNIALENANTIIDRVSAITALKERDPRLVEDIQINTGYYYEPPEDNGARDLLSDMSIEGAGDFVEFGSGQEIDLNRFAIPMRVSRFVLKDIWAVNVNVGWYNGELRVDSDADGLVDEQEEGLGSNPFLYDSDGNGVGDGVEYRVSGGVKACEDPLCLTTNANPYTMCRSLEIPNAPFQYDDSDSDYLNDCEERLLGSNLHEGDSNLDFVPDYLAFKANLNINEQGTSLTRDPDTDNWTNYDELKHNSPLRVPDSQVFGLVYTSYSGQIVSDTPEKTCYSYAVHNLVQKTENDTVRFFVMEATVTMQEKRYIQTAEKRLVRGSLSIRQDEFN
jgi:hypothetical protein